MSGEKRTADEPSWEFTDGLLRGILMGGSFVFMGVEGLVEGAGPRRRADRGGKGEGLGTD